MSAKSNEPAMVQEIYNIATLTCAQLEELQLDKARFLAPTSAADDLVSEGVMLRVLRLTEELGRIGQETAEAFGFESRSARDLRNRLAHAYGSIDRELVWGVIEHDLPGIIQSCLDYADDLGIDLAATSIPFPDSPTGSC